MLGVFKRNKNKETVSTEEEVVVKKRVKNKNKEDSRNKEIKAKNSKLRKKVKDEKIVKENILSKRSNLVKEDKNRKKVKVLHKKPEVTAVKDNKEDMLFGIPLEFSIERTINMLQKKLRNVTRLTPREKEYFEKLYKVAYVISYSTKIPVWLQYYDLLFIGEEHAIIISKFNTSAGPLVSIKEIMNISLKIESLTTLFFKLEFLINQMIKMYNEGKNYNYHFKDSIEELKTLRVIPELLYKKLMFLAKIRSKVGRAWNASDVKFYLPSGKIEKLKNKEYAFKTILSEVYVSIVEIYMKIQQPYLKKFFLLWESKELNIGTPNSFYHI